MAAPAPNPRTPKATVNLPSLDPSQWVGRHRNSGRPQLSSGLAPAGAPPSIQRASTPRRSSSATMAMMSTVSRFACGTSATTKSTPAFSSPGGNERPGTGGPVCQSQAWRRTAGTPGTPYRVRGDRAFLALSIFLNVALRAPGLTCATGRSKRANRRQICLSHNRLADDHAPIKTVETIFLLQPRGSDLQTHQRPPGCPWGEDHVTMASCGIHTLFMPVVHRS